MWSGSIAHCTTQHITGKVNLILCGIYHSFQWTATQLHSCGSYVPYIWSLSGELPQSVCGTLSAEWQTVMNSRRRNMFHAEFDPSSFKGVGYFQPHFITLSYHDLSHGHYSQWYGQLRYSCCTHPTKIPQWAYGLHNLPCSKPQFVYVCK